MAEHNETGKFGEAAAMHYLQNLNYQILARNWRYKKAEVDLFAKKGNLLSCVEVKTRKSIFYGRPDEFVSHKKLKLLVDAAVVFAEGMGHDGEVSFDIISVLFHHPQSYRIVHHEDVYFPGRPL